MVMVKPTQEVSQLKQVQVLLSGKKSGSLQVAPHIGKAGSK